MEQNDLMKWKKLGDEDALSISMLFSSIKYTGQDQIADYLDKGQISIVSTSLTEEKISGGLITPHILECVMTNGEFSWPGSLSYYVREYNLKFPAEYEDYILAKRSEMFYDDGDMI